MLILYSLAGVAMACLIAVAACARDTATGKSRPDLIPSPRPESSAPAKSANPPASAFPKPQRPVAAIVSSQWSDEAARDRAGEATRVIDLLGIGPGMSVADIGAGSGYYTTRIAPVVGPQGRVYAEDVIPNYIEALFARVQKAGLDNVAIVLGEPDNPKLPPNSIDLALFVHMYHEIQQPYALLYNLVPALRPEGRVAVVDADRPTDRHGTPPDLLRCEMEALGYQQTELYHLSKAEAYLAVFTPPAPEELPEPETIKSCVAR